jgi:hypothetical protein
MFDKNRNFHADVAVIISLFSYEEKSSKDKDEFRNQ